MPVDMTVERLESYQGLRQAIIILRCELNAMNTTEEGLGSSIIKDYQTGFPRPQAVVGFDEERYKRKRHQLDTKEAEAAEIRDWVEAIEDVLARKVFEYYYLDGRPWREIAKLMGYGNNPDYPRLMIRDAYLKKVGMK